MLKILQWIANKQRYAKFPRFTFRKFDKSKIFINDDLCYVVKSKKTNPTDKAFIFIHGGAFISQIAKSHWLMIRKLINNTNSTCYVPIYRLSNP
jgi:acetyl esterase/lipase